MRVFNRLLLSSVGLLGLACSGPSHDGSNVTGNVAAPIINGTAMTDAESLVSPAVDIVACVKGGTPQNKGCQEGSGMMLKQTTPDGRNIVLTARHVIDYIQDVSPRAGEAIDPTTIVVGHGNPAVRTAAAIKGRPWVYSVSVATFNDDVAILFLDRQLARPQTVLPELDCDPPDPDAILCESAVRHVLAPSFANPIGDVVAAAKMNTGVFTPSFVQLTRGPDIIQYDPNDFKSQAIAHGDSGSGCKDLVSLKLSVVMNGTRGLHDNPMLAPLFDVAPLSNVGLATKVQPLCQWINATIQTGAKFAFETDVGDGDGVEDVVALTQIAGDSHVLTVDRSALGEQSFDVTITQVADSRGPGDPQIDAAMMGNFTGGKQSLILSESGTLVGVAINDGPEPLVQGAPSTDYAALQKVRVNSDSVDDLVAQRADGQLDVFLGGTSGLQFNASIKPVPMRLDRDRLPDYVWLDGAKINSFSTVLQDAQPPGLTSRTVIPNTLSLVKVAPGLFRDFKLETPGALNGGIQDIVTLSSPATGGAVIWCKSTGFGLQCNPALDWQNNTGRIATDFVVTDVNGDRFDDIVVSYSNANTAPRAFLGGAHGFPTNFGRGTRHAGGGDFTGDGAVDTITIDEDPPVAVGPPSGNIALKVQLNDGTVLPSVVLPVPYIEPVLAQLANFNGDQGTIMARGNADAIQVPIKDIAILSGDRVFALISNADGTFTVNTPAVNTGYVSIDTGDVTGDGIDDLEAMRADGSVTVFAGVSGSGQGLATAGENFTGLPTADTNDGKMVVLSGLGVDTVAATDARFKLTVDPGDTAALDHLTVQIFDGNNQGLHQFDKETNVLKTCYRLSADPCGDGSLGNCNGGTRPKVLITTVSSDTLNDDVWDTIFEGPHSPDASLTGNGQAPFIYELYVYLSQDCNVLPTAGSTIQVATADAFKVRSNAMVSHPAGELSIIGSDSDGPFGIPDQPYMRDTDYDGTFSLPISVGASAVEVQLKEADADDTQDSTPGVSLGANADIAYQLLRPDGTPASLVGAEDTTPTLRVTNPSGDNNGSNHTDVETRIASITTSTPGTWTWQWQNVMASNAIHLFGPFGSPTTHEVLGARRERPTTTTVQQPYFWDDGIELAAHLPVVLGNRLPDGTLEGHSIVVSTVDDATAFLANAAATQEGELEKQLLVAKLNMARSLELGEDVKGALVYGTTTSVRTTMHQADQVVAGVAVWSDDAQIGRVVSMLSSVNLGQITYQDTGVPFPEAPMADDDGDGVLNVKDNCPTIANPLQESTHGDKIGDACRARPIAECVLQRSATKFDAFFSYDNPLSYRIIPVGTRNGVGADNAALDVGQPTELAGGTKLRAFTASFDGTSPLSWTLDGSTAKVTRDTPRCSGAQLAQVDFAKRVVLFGTEAVEVGDYASVLAGGDLPTIVSNGDVVLGADVVVGDVLSGGRTVVGEEALVRGSIAAGGGLVRQKSAAIEGRKLNSAAPPWHSIDWMEASDAGSSVELGSGQDQALAPGTYGKIVVRAGGLLRLQSGTYQVESLFVAEGGTVALASGEVVVHVQSSLSHLGETRLLESSAHITLGYFGTDSALIGASLRGTLVAPNAELVLGSARNMDFAGAFFARRLTVKPGTIVEYAAF